MAVGSSACPAPDGDGRMPSGCRRRSASFGGTTRIWRSRRRGGGGNPLPPVPVPRSAMRQAVAMSLSAFSWTIRASIRCLRRNAPYALGETVNERSTLPPFVQVRERFARMVPRRSTAIQPGRSGADTSALRAWSRGEVRLYSRAGQARIRALCAHGPAE